MNQEFAHDGNASVWKVEELDPLSISRATLHFSNVEAKCSVNRDNGDNFISCNKSTAEQSSTNKLHVVPDSEVVDDGSYQSRTSTPTMIVIDKLATETHMAASSNVCGANTKVRETPIQARSSILNEDFKCDPSSGSFYCDDKEPDILHDSDEEVFTDIPTPLQRYEPTLEDLMTIMEFDEPNAHDDYSLTKETYHKIESALSTAPVQDKLIAEDVRESSSDLFPTSSLEFMKVHSSHDNIKNAKQVSSVPPCSNFFDDHKQTFERTQEIAEHWKDMNGKCSPNRPHPALEYPLLYFFLRRWPWLFENIKILYAYRWRLSYPLQRNVPYGARIRKMGVHSTWGELLILLPFFAGILCCLVYTIVFPSVSVTGKIARYGLISSFAFAQKNSLVTLVIGMPFDRGMFYHKVSGRLAGVAGVLHTIAFFIDPKYQRIHQHDFCSGAFTGAVNISGSVMMLIVLGIFVSAMSRLRRRVYEVFYYLHLIFSVGIITCAFFHSGILVPILAALTWGVDLFIRSIVMARTLYPQKVTLKVVSDTVVEVSFPKTAAFAYNPGQYVYLAIPEISWLQWHPFSISSSPKQRVVTLHIRKVGNWTKDLFELSKTKSSVSILLEGPYGNLSVDLMNDRKYTNVLLISGGIGITPMQSICEQLLYEKVKNRRKLNSLKFVWIERDPVLLQESAFVKRSSSLGSIVSVELDDDFLSSNASKSFSFDEILTEEEQRSGPIDFDSSFEMYIASLDHETRRKRFLEGDYCCDIIEQILSVLPPGSTSDKELDALYQSGELALDDKDVPFGSCDKQKHNAPSPEKASRCKPKRPSFVPDEETSFAENDQCWLTEAAKIHENLFKAFDMQVYLTSKAPGTNQIPFARYGRPDVKKIFLEMKAEALNSVDRRIAVCVSAPKSLTNMCRKACVLFSDDEVQFDFHSETMSL